MKKANVVEYYELESYEEIKQLVDAGEIVECTCEIHDWCAADFIVEKNEDGEYVVREEFDTPIDEHELSDFHLVRYIY